MRTIQARILPDRSWTFPRPIRGPHSLLQGRRLGVWLLAILDRLVLWQTRRTQRQALAELDGRLLKDMALSRADVARETGKPFWRA